MRHKPIFETCVESAGDWLDTVMRALALPPTQRARGMRALRAGLHAIRDRLPAAEVVQLGAQLPTLIRGIYYEGWALRNDPTQIRTRAAMIARVRRGLGNDPALDALHVLRATLELLVARVSPGEIEDIRSTLPGPIRELWIDLLAAPFGQLAPRGRRARRASATDSRS
jgi:uncharacterized protein (DUF2267 family)